MYGYIYFFCVVNLNLYVYVMIFEDFFFNLNKILIICMFNINLDIIFVKFI